MPVSEIARHGLQAAADHLSAVRLHIEASRPFVFSDLTLCRSALLGAATAVWVLVPDEPAVRLTRSRTVALEEHRKHRQYLRDLRAIAPQHEDTATVAAIVQSYVSELEQKRAGAGEKSELDSTAVIREAVRAVLNADHAAEAVLAWRSSSGAAHGFMWQMMGTADTVQSSAADEKGFAEFIVGASLSRFSNCYLAAFITAQHGWKLLRQRGGKTPRSQTDPATPTRR